MSQNEVKDVFHYYAEAIVSEVHESCVRASEVIEGQLEDHLHVSVSFKLDHEI